MGILSAFASSFSISASSFSISECAFSYVRSEFIGWLTSNVILATHLNINNITYLNKSSPCSSSVVEPTAYQQASAGSIPKQSRYKTLSQLQWSLICTSLHSGGGLPDKPIMAS